VERLRGGAWHEWRSPRGASTVARFDRIALGDRVVSGGRVLGHGDDGHCERLPRRRIRRGRTPTERSSDHASSPQLTARRWRVAFSRLPHVLMLHHRRRPPRDESRNNQPHRSHARIRSGGSVKNAWTASSASTVGIASGAAESATRSSRALSTFRTTPADIPAPARSRRMPKRLGGTGTPRDTASNTAHACSRTSRTSATSFRAAASVRRGALLSNPTDLHHESTSDGDFNSSLSATGFDRLNTVLVRSKTG
jgi:hypothetical protein